MKANNIKKTLIVSVTLCVSLLIALGSMTQFVFAEETTYSIRENGGFVYINSEVTAFRDNNNLYVINHGIDKQVPSGNFYIRDSQQKILVFGTFMDDNLRINVYYHDKETGKKQLLSFLEKFDKAVVSTQTEIIEPKSSIGADIPVIDYSEAEKIKNHDAVTVKFTSQVKSQYNLGDEFWLSGSARDVSKYRGNLENATVSYTITHVNDDFVLREGSAITPGSGYVKFKIGSMNYPEFYPNWCYNLSVVIEWNGSLNTQIEQFKVIPYGSSIQNLDWSEKWNYLPSDYRIEPRIITHSDEKCN